MVIRDTKTENREEPVGVEDRLLSGGGADFGDGFCVSSGTFGDPANGVGDGPYCTGDGDANGIARPVEMVMRAGDELGNPDQYFEADDLSGEQTRGERSHDARKDGGGGEEETDSRDIGPEHLRRRNPTGDPGQQAGHIDNVDNAEGDCGEAGDTGKQGLAARDRRTGR